VSATEAEPLPKAEAGSPTPGALRVGRWRS